MALSYQSLRNLSGLQTIVESKTADVRMGSNALYVRHVLNFLRSRLHFLSITS